ncbi:MAG: hypothetical protein ACRDTG_20600 [Pseudonocardiaceae bacterium]
MDSESASEQVYPSSALFGPDGTELPDPLPVLLDPLTGPDLDTWRDFPAPPPGSTLFR